MRPLKDVTVTAGDSATFECELSYEGIIVDWFLGGKKMDASERVSAVRTGITGGRFFFLFSHSHKVPRGSAQATPRKNLQVIKLQ